MFDIILRGNQWSEKLNWFMIIINLKSTKSFRQLFHTADELLLKVEFLTYVKNIKCLIDLSISLWKKLNLSGLICINDSNDFILLKQHFYVYSLILSLMLNVIELILDVNLIFLQPLIPLMTTFLLLVLKCLSN